MVVASDIILDRLSDEKASRGKAFLGDSVFVTKTRVVHGKITRGRKATETKDDPESALLAAVEKVLKRAMPCERQNA